jgi:hypothetical protein
MRDDSARYADAFHFRMIFAIFRDDVCAADRFEIVVRARSSSTDNAHYEAHLYRWPFGGVLNARVLRLCQAGPSDVEQRIVRRGQRIACGRVVSREAQVISVD